MRSGVNRETYNISYKDIRYNNLMQQGLIYIFTGEGKGKTSAALGVAIRAMAAGLRVAIVQWYKDPSWRISDHQIGSFLTPEAKARFAIYPLGAGFHLKNSKTAPLKTGQVVIDKATDEEHRQKAHQALDKALSLVNTVDVLILDEINNAIEDQLITVDETINLISQRQRTHLILTGRDAHPEIIKLADLVTSMTKIKHPYDQGVLAVKGLDF